MLADKIPSGRPCNFFTGQPMWNAFESPILHCTNPRFGHPGFPCHKNGPAPHLSSFLQTMPSALFIQYKNTTKMTPEGPNHVATVGVPDRSGATSSHSRSSRSESSSTCRMPHHISPSQPIHPNLEESTYCEQSAMKASKRRDSVLPGEKRRRVGRTLPIRYAGGRAT